MRRTLRSRAKAKPLATHKELSDFLAEVERRAYKQALFAVRDDHVALDIVQDAMLKLAEKYADRPPPELPLLFQRILQNTIRDFYRRQKVRVDVDDAGVEPVRRRSRRRGATRWKLWRWRTTPSFRSLRPSNWSVRKFLL